MGEIRAFARYDKTSRYYIDPYKYRSECVTVKPADPKLLEKNKQLIKDHNRNAAALRGMIFFSKKQK